MEIKDKIFIEEIKPKKGSIFIAHVDVGGLAASDFKTYRKKIQKELMKFFEDKRFIIDYCYNGRKALDVEIIEPTRKATKIDYLRYFFKFVCDKVRGIENE